MKLKTIHLTEQELRNKIAESVIQVMNAIDAKTYTRVHNATNKAKEGNDKANSMGVIHKITSIRKT